MTLGGKNGTYQIKKKCYQYDMNGNIISEYENVAIAIEKYGYAIYQCLAKYSLSAYGYLWSYKKYEKISKYSRKNNSDKQVHMYDLSGIYLKSYESTIEAEKDTNIPSYRIISCANGQTKSAGGYLWTYIKQETISPYKEYIRKGISKDISHRKKPVYQYDLNGKFIQKFNTVKDANIEVGATCYGGISACCKNKQKSAYGYIWSYTFENIDRYSSITNERKIIQFNKDNDSIVINTFDSVQSAERITNIPHSNILKCCKGDRHSAGGYGWKYA